MTLKDKLKLMKEIDARNEQRVRAWKTLNGAKRWAQKNGFEYVEK